MFYNGATTFFVFMDAIQAVGLHRSNPRPAISYSGAMGFLDQIEEEHGDTYVYDMLVFVTVNPDYDGPVQVPREDMARAISGW